jgi:hypothetical protein
MEGRAATRLRDGPCEPPVLTDHDLFLAMTSFFFETEEPPPRPGPDP